MTRIRARIGLGAVVLQVLTACDAGNARGASGALAYPAAAHGTIVDTYHGTQVADPYRWLETLDAPETRAWASAQNALVTQIVGTDSLRAWFLARMQYHARSWDQLDAGEPGLVLQGNEFQLVWAPDSTHQLLRMKRAGSTDSARVFVDPRALGPTKNLVRFQASPDGKHVAYALSEGATEWVETRIRRVVDGADLPDVLDGMLGAAVLWSRDSRGVFYVHQLRGDSATRVMLREPSVRYHAINTAQSADRVLFATPPRSVESVLQISYASRGRYLVIEEGSGAFWEPFAWIQSRMHLLDLGDAPTPASGSSVNTIVPDKIAGYRVVASDGPTLYVLTDRDAPRKRVVAMDVRDPAVGNWREVVPQDARLVLHAMRRINGRFVGVYLDNAQPLIRVYSGDGVLLQSMRLPAFSSVPDVEGGERDAELSVMVSSFLRPPTRMIFDVLTGASRVVETASTDFDTASYVASQEWYLSKDGTRVPMFLVHRRNIALDGSHPVLMLGYGASGSVMLPEFSEYALAWLEAGGIFAMPSLRGGGEFGRAWYEAATLDRKQTSFDDFIAAAEWLVSKGYTKPERIAIRGASNGGLLVSGTITQRPDLFGAAIAEVPITDNLRYDRGRHRGQFGHVSDSAQFESLYRYSPLHGVKTGTCYPATLVTTVLNDDRAPAWHALKFTAALQAAQGCDKPILVRAADVGGHFGDRGPTSWMEDAADAMAFAGRRLGMTMATVTAVSRKSPESRTKP